MSDLVDGGTGSRHRGRRSSLFTFPSSGRWWLRSWDAADQATGFRRSSLGAVYDRPVDGDDLSRVLHDTSKGDEARERGMVEKGRDGWKKEVASDDPDLAVVQTVDEIPPPWPTSS